MFFVFFILLSFIPASVGITILFLFRNNKLSKASFLFLLFASFWQLDVSFLYSYHLLKEETVLWFFRLLRFGSIMVTPTIFYVAYTIVQELPANGFKTKWRFIVNRTTVLLSYGLALLAYITGWSDKGISGLETIQLGTNKFYFPINGELSWIFMTNLLLFLVSIVFCFLMTLHVQNKTERSFLMYFNIFTSIGYTIGSFNMFSVSRLLPSSIAILVFAISVLILSTRMNHAIINQKNKELFDQKRFLFHVIDLNPNYIYAQDKMGRYTLINQSYAQLIGTSIQDMIGKTDDEIQKNQAIKKQVLGQERNLFKLPDKIFIREESITASSGEAVWVQTVKVPIKVNNDSAVLAVSTDITERKQYEDEIKFQANHDALTGLPNRRMFNEDLANLLEKAKTEENEVAIMFLDLDRFKYINDTLGHDVGDLLLVEVSGRMENFLKKKHTNARIYRLGGDEFTILLPHYNVTDSEAFAKELLEQFEDSFLFDGIENYITPSIGISIFPQDGDDVNTLIKHADTAMYYVKATGKCNYQLFTSEMQQQFYRKMMLEKQLRTALDNEEFELYYQPIVDLKTNEIIGMESLIRWNNKILGQVFPDEFIPIAEETGMIIPIGDWVLNTAIEQNLRWQKEGYGSFKININISVRQILEQTFLENVKAAIEHAAIDPAYIVLEITESIAMYDGSMIEKLSALKELGISLSMDDFGTGYSSLSYLNKYPLDSMKIDKSFVMGMNQDKESKAIVKMIVAIAKQLDLKVIAEGVEEEADYQFLSEIGCDFAQGYFISRPLPVASLEKNCLQQSFAMVY